MWRNSDAAYSSSVAQSTLAPFSGDAGDLTLCQVAETFMETITLGQVNLSPGVPQWKGFRARERVFTLGSLFLTVKN